MILARHAEALFWTGRHLERIEHTTRLLDVVGRNSMHRQPERAVEEWQRVLRLLGLATAYGIVDGTPGDRPLDEADVVGFLFDDRDNPGSVVAAATQLKENVRTVRDRVPVELWEESNRLDLLLRNPVEQAIGADRFELFSAVRRSCQTVTGVVTEAMPRDEGYAFTLVGRMLERATLMCRLIRHAVCCDQAADSGTSLRIASSLQAYRRQHGYDDEALAIAQFLLCARRVPRSVLSCLLQIERRLIDLERGSDGLAPAMQLAGRVRSRLEYGVVEEQLIDDADRAVLELEAELIALDRTIAVHAFDPAHASILTAQFVRPGWDAP